MRTILRNALLIAVPAALAAACGENPAATKGRDPVGVFNVVKRTVDGRPGVVAQKSPFGPRALVRCEIDVPCDPPEWPSADFDYGSYTDFRGTQPDPYWGTVKVLDLWSWQQSYSHVQQHSIHGSFQSVQASSGSYCNNNPVEFGTSDLSTSGNPYYTPGSPYYLAVGWEVTWPDMMKWRVEGEHTFVPQFRYSGGTFYSSAIYCG